MASARLGATTLTALSIRSDGKGLARLSGHLAVLTLTGALVWTLRDGAWVAPALVLHAYVLSFLFCALHEPRISRRFVRAG